MAVFMTVPSTVIVSEASTPATLVNVSVRKAGFRDLYKAMINLNFSGYVQLTADHPAGSKT
jgi:hypothetical protein